MDTVMTFLGGFGVGGLATFVMLHCIVKKKKGL